MLEINHNAGRAPQSCRSFPEFGTEAAASAESIIARHPDHRPTPMLTLHEFAREFRIGGLHVKDESNRLGLNSFKALGGYHAVSRLLEERNRADTTFACASAGNHGLAVAVAAAKHGAQCVVFVSDGVASNRVRALETAGARVIRIAGRYDDAVAAAATEAELRGWTFLPDTSWDGCELPARLVMQGYLVLMVEALRQMTEPSHVFVQAGVGGLAGAIAAHLAIVAPVSRVIVVQAARAASIVESVRADRLHRIPAGEPTPMSMLECYQPSLIAWRVLRSTAHAFITIDDEAAAAADRTFSSAGIRSTPSGAAGFAALLDVAQNPSFRRVLDLDEHSNVLLINTEGPPR